MKLIVDTNVIFSALIKDADTRRILTHLDAEFLTVKFFGTELAKYKTLILKKSKQSEPSFNALFSGIRDTLVFLDDGLIIPQMKEALQLIGKVDPKDAPFIAAALATGADIWSDDKHFEKQTKIKVWKTKELVALM